MAKSFLGSWGMTLHHRLRYLYQIRRVGRKWGRYLVGLVARTWEQMTEEILTVLHLYVATTTKEIDKTQTTGINY